MTFDLEKKKTVCAFSIHVELIMWGDVFLNFETNNAGEPEISWLSICEGGDIQDKGSKIIAKGKYSEIIDYLFSIDYPEQEDDEMNVSWEICCADINGDEVAGIGFGNWDKNVLIDIANRIAEILDDEEPLSSIMNTIEA